MYKGSCLCGKIRYEIKSEPESVTHCHCTMCQKQHGAAFATYANLPRQDLVYTGGQDWLAHYGSSAKVQRKFCRNCGSSLEWSGGPERTSIAIATLDSVFNPASIEDIYTDTRVCWLQAD